MRKHPKRITLVKEQIESITLLSPGDPKWEKTLSFDPFKEKSSRLEVIIYFNQKLLLKLIQIKKENYPLTLIFPYQGGRAQANIKGITFLKQLAEDKRLIYFIGKIENIIVL